MTKRLREYQDLVKHIFEYDDTYKNVFKETLKSLPKYLRWRCISNDDENEETDCCFMKIFLYVELYDSDGSIIKVYESLSCLECLENHLIDELYAIHSFASFLLRRKIYDEIPFDEVYDAVSKIINDTKIQCDSYLSLTVHLDRCDTSLNGYKFSFDKKSNTMDNPSWNFETFII
jgi:hypothetical protein